MSQADDDAASFPDSDAGLMRGYLGVDDAKFWFVLSQNRLSYFEDADADVPLGTLPVDAVRSVRASKLNPREYAMRISTADVAFHRELSTSRGAPPPPRNSSARNSFGAQFGFDARFPPSLRSLVDARARRHRAHPRPHVALRRRHRARPRQRALVPALSRLPQRRRRRRRQPVAVVPAGRVVLRRRRAAARRRAHAL